MGVGRNEPARPHFFSKGNIMSKKDETVAPAGDDVVVADQGLVEVKSADGSVAPFFSPDPSIKFGWQEAAENSK